MGVSGNLTKKVPQWFSMDLILLGHTKTESERCQGGTLGHFLKWAGLNTSKPAITYIELEI